MGLPVSNLITSAYEKDIQYEVWKESLAPLMLAEQPEITSGFRGHATLVLADDIVCAKTDFDPLNYQLNKARIEQADANCFLLQMYTKGGYKGLVNGEVVQVPPGSISFLDLRYELSTQTESSTVITFVVPFHVFPDAQLPLSGSVLSPTEPCVSLLGQQLLLFWRRVPSLESASARLIAKNLIRSALELFEQQNCRVSRSPNQIRFDRVQAYIENYLDQPDKLEEALICKQFSCSRATLYRWFSVHGGLNKYIKQRRLQRIYKILLSNSDVEITRVAHQFGFRSLSHFSRSFRDQFDVPPSKVMLTRSTLNQAGYEDRLSVHHPEYTSWLQNI